MHRDLCASRQKGINNFTRQFGKILKRAGVRKGQFHDLRRTALSNWFSSGMSENDIMTLAGHSSFSTTHEFYLAVSMSRFFRESFLGIQSFLCSLFIVLFRRAALDRSGGQHPAQAQDRGRLPAATRKSD